MSDSASSADSSSTMGASATDSRTVPRSIFAPALRGLTIAFIALIFLAAFDQSAVMTVMPTIMRALESDSSAAFTSSFTLVSAASIVAMVMGGVLTDRIGAVRTLRASLIVFACGLALSVVAPNLAVFLLSRVIQGLGSGALIVAIYGLIAVHYPDKLQPRIFSAFSGAWVLPALIGPGIAGLIVSVMSWHWIFAFSAIIAIVCLFAIPRRDGDLSIPGGAQDRSVPTQSSSAEDDSAGINTTTAPGAGRRKQRNVIVGAFVLALAAVPMSASPEFGTWGIIPLFGGLFIALLALRPLTPAGTLRLRRGLPSIVFSRLAFDAFVATEVLLPLLFTERDHLPPTLAGIALSATGIGWFAASEVQTRYINASLDQCIRTAALLIGIATGGVAFFCLIGGHWSFIVAVWLLMGIGAGYVYPVLTAQAMSLAPDGQEGFVGSALQVMGMTGFIFSLGIAGWIHTAVAGSPGVVFTVIFSVFAASTIPFALLSRRVTPVSSTAVA